MPKIGRDILKQFLPNHETIVAFERLLDFVDTTAPSDIEVVLSLVSSVKRVNTNNIDARLRELESPTARRSDNSRTEGRLGIVEGQTPRNVNLNSILARLDALEAAARRRELNTAILARLDTIEKFIGV